MPNKNKRTRVKYSDVRDIIVKAANARIERNLAEKEMVILFGEETHPADVPGVIIDQLNKLGFLNHSRIEGLGPQ